MDTYVNVGDDESGFVEFDLVSIRHRGVEEKYLVIKLKSFDNNEEQPKEYELSVSLKSKDHFNQIKSFFSKLDWEA